MWEFPGGSDESRFLVIAHAPPGYAAGLPPLAKLSGELRERLILYGPLRVLDTGELSGVALALQASNREQVEQLLRAAGVRLDAFGRIEIHDWEFGGRR